MPIYCFKCQECSVEMEIIRSMADSDIPPSTDEEPQDESRPCTHKWTKIIKHAPKKSYGESWGYRKGFGYRGSDW